MSFSAKIDSGNYSNIPNSLDVAGLGWGLAIGDDRGFSSEMKELTRRAGVSHLTAASGSNIHLAQSLATPLESYFWLHWSSRLALIFIYLGISGSSGSLLRASWQAVYSCVCLALGRPVFAPWSLLQVLLAGTALGWISGLGFRLSWLAVGALSLSRFVLSGENNYTLLPQAFDHYNWLRKTVVEGTLVLLAVSIPLYTMFGAWQPQGLIGTAVSQPFTTPYLFIFLFSILLYKSNLVAEIMTGQRFAVFDFLMHVLLVSLAIFLNGFWNLWEFVGNLPWWISVIPVVWGSYETVRLVFVRFKAKQRNKDEGKRWGWSGFIHSS